MLKPTTLRGVSGETNRGVADQGKAVLFCHLAQFLVWGQQHTDVRQNHPEFDRLLRATASILEGVGTLERFQREPQAIDLTEYLPEFRESGMPDAGPGAE